LLLLLVATVFLAAIVAPYRVDSDTGFQLRSVQQWLRGESPSPVTLRIPDPGDLSRDALVWSSWWPPGFPVLYAPLAATGLPLAAALRLTSFLLFLAGAVGWMRFADGLRLPRLARWLYVVSLAAYAVTVGGAATLASADNLTFAAAPWLSLLVLHQARPRPAPGVLLLCGAALGAAYFLKYTLFLTSIALAAWLAAQLLRYGEGSKRARLLHLAALGLGVALPVAGLISLNAWQTGRVAESATGARSLWKAEDPLSARPLPLALGLLGAPGLGLFQSHLWITHLCYFSDRELAFLRPLDEHQRLLAKALAGSAGTVALLWALSRSRGGLPAARQLPLALTAAAGFLVALGVVSLAVSYNYPAKEPRYSVGIMPLLHPFVLGGLLAAAGRESRRSARAAAWAVLAVFFAAPVLFAAGFFFHGELGKRLAARYTPSATGLYVPELSARNVPEVRAQIAAVLRSPQDVVVLAGPAGTGASQAMWLETPWRTLPVSTFSLPLGGRFARAADLRETLPFLASRPLRVVLVASLSLQKGRWLSRLLRRFPQAQAWTSVPPARGAGVGIWFADLKVPG
jgi:hypothetical protein